MLIDVGLPIMRGSSLYNCRLIMFKGKVLLIRPKIDLAKTGLYREERWFTAWPRDAAPVWYSLPPVISKITGQTHVPFGCDVIIEINDTASHNSLRIGIEICEELWKPYQMHTQLFSEHGVHFITNSSASYWEVRKLNRVLDIIKSATERCGGCYAFSNAVGMDGGGAAVYYGRSTIVQNGTVQDMTHTETTKEDILDEVALAYADIQVSRINAYRASHGINNGTASTRPGTILFISDLTSHSLRDLSVHCEIHISMDRFGVKLNELPHRLPSIIIPAHEISTYGSLWLWDYLRRSRVMKGFIVPLSGGLDSSSVACLVWELANKLATCENQDVKREVRRILDIQIVNDGRRICNKLLRCVYLSTQFNSASTLKRAEDLSKFIGVDLRILNMGPTLESISPSLTEPGHAVTTLEQNLQARIRMALTYHFSEGNRLVLSTANVDESLVGYLTKYDCSSADLNPIGSISKRDLRQYLAHVRDKYTDEATSETFNEILNATPSAELTGQDQSDEQEMGMTYDELSVLGRLRKGQLGSSLGPVGMFQVLWQEHNNRESGWFGIGRLSGPDVTPQVIAEIVKTFFKRFCSNRHKAVVASLSLHAESYSQDDHRFDHRQVLYSNLTTQFQKIDEIVKNETVQ